MCVIHIKRDNFPPKFLLVNQKYNKNLLLLLLPPFFCFQCLLFFCYSWLISQLSLGAILMEERHNKSTMKKWHDLKKKKNKNEKKRVKLLSNSAQAAVDYNSVWTTTANLPYLSWCSKTEYCLPSILLSFLFSKNCYNFKLIISQYV